MKVLLDTCVWWGAKKELEAAGYDVEWTGDTTDPGDEEILARAYREDRVLISLDKGFGERIIKDKKPHHGHIRLVRVFSQDQGRLCIQLLQKYGPQLEAGAIIIADMKRARIRPTLF